MSQFEVTALILRVVEIGLDVVMLVLLAAIWRK